MQSAQDAWNNMSAAQKREVLTANVMVALGPMVKSNLGSLVANIKNILLSEAQKIRGGDSRLQLVLIEAARVPQSVEGLRQLEALQMKAPKTPGLLPILQKCFKALPPALQFPGFYSLVEHHALSKFVEFAMNWKYSGKGYEAPNGMAAPFSGYDDIINSLMGHPLCRAEMEKQAKLWQQAQGQ